eukprot:373309-Prorocentrum_minimum.AAC.4
MLSCNTLQNIHTHSLCLNGYFRSVRLYQGQARTHQHQPGSTRIFWGLQVANQSGDRDWKGFPAAMGSSFLDDARPPPTDPLGDASRLPTTDPLAALGLSDRLARPGN